MRLHDSATSYISQARLIQAFWTVRAASNDMAVLFVLAVVLPSALVADFVCTSLRQGRVTAARAGVYGASCCGAKTFLCEVYAANHSVRRRMSSSSDIDGSSFGPRVTGRSGTSLIFHPADAFQEAGPDRPDLPAITLSRWRS
jgi:hypothetical protein